MGERKTTEDEPDRAGAQETDPAGYRSDGTARLRVPSRIFASQLRDTRQRQGLSAADVAERVRRLDRDFEPWYKLDRAAISKIENGHRGVSLDEALVLSFVLNVAPVHLIVPRTDDENLIIANEREAELEATVARAWFRGDEQLPGRDDKVFRTEVPDSEWLQRTKRLDHAEKAVDQAERRLRVLRVKSRQLSSDLAEVEGANFSRAGETLNSMSPQYRRLSAKLDLCYDELAEAAVDLIDAQRHLHQVKSEEGDLGRAGKADLFRVAADELREGKPLSPAMTAAAEMLKPIIAKADAGEDDGGLATALRQEPKRLSALRDFLEAVEAAPSGEGYLSDRESQLVQEHRQRKSESE